MKTNPPKVEGVDESGDVNQIDFATNVKIPQHDETLAELKTRYLLRSRQPNHRRRTASGRTGCAIIDYNSST